MKFKQFLQEQKEKHAVLAFGRMNPPTTGHEVLVNKVKSVADEVGGSHHVVLSHSQDKAKNPLSAKQKVKHAKRFFPNTNISVSDKEHPNFLSQAAKLHKQGVTHLHMVAGSDRVPEYHKLLHKYNGTHEGALFNFKHIKVHSAGERDPDAEGTSGMSASKMRGHASSGNFNEFRKGIPGHVKHEHAKELYNDVRKNMGVNEDVNEFFEEILVEGVHDKGIFKAAFLAGGPGSGKDYVLDNTLAGHGLTEINSDKALEFLMDKEGLDKKMPDNEEKQRDVIRTKAKNMTELRQKLALQGRNGLIINGTGDDYEKIKRIKEKLEQLGYETSMILVNTRDDVSALRNIQRGQRGGRTVPEKIRKQKWDAVQDSRPKFAELFKGNYVEFDNSEDLTNAQPEVIASKKQELLDIFKQMQKFVGKAPKNDVSKEWIGKELGKKDTLPVPKTNVENKHRDIGSKAAQEAKKMGLTYFGFGRWGKNGKVTHHEVHGNLVANQINEQFENFIAEAVTVTISGDTPEEVSKTIQLLKSDDVEEVKEEDEIEINTFSNGNALTLLTLGKGLIKESDSKFDLHHDKLMKDSKGKVRKFSLRRSAAKEAHTHNGVVYKLDNHYVIKIKENVNVKESLGMVEQTNRSESGRISTNSTTSGRISESGYSRTNSTSKKITLEEIRFRQKEKLNEIDAGIEPGLSMASSGENFSRGIDRGMSTSGVKFSRDPKKKTIKELTGDETTMSIGDKKEDELKKAGISLKSFKAKKFV